MTYIIETESLGNIESGFYSGFVEFIRIGKYAAPTEHFCGLVRSLADNPEIKKGKFLVYPESKFLERFSDSIADLVKQVTKEPSWLSGLENWKDPQQQGRVRLEDEVDMLNERYSIPVDISSDGKKIDFGEYSIISIHFARFAWYVAKGGIVGWIEGGEPDYADQTIKAIRDSRNPLFTELQKEILTTKNERPETISSFGARVGTYYRENELPDGRGRRLQAIRLAELGQGVASVLDSLNEVDIFFDLERWKVAKSAPRPYSLFLEGVRENALKNAAFLRAKYGMTVIAESAWHPYYGRRHASFAASFEAAKAYLIQNNDKQAEMWHKSPITIN